MAGHTGRRRQWGPKNVQKGPPQDQKHRQPHTPFRWIAGLGNDEPFPNVWTNKNTGILKFNLLWIQHEKREHVRQKMEYKMHAWRGVACPRWSTHKQQRSGLSRRSIRLSHETICCFSRCCVSTMKRAVHTRQRGTQHCDTREKSSTPTRKYFSPHHACNCAFVSAQMRIMTD